jgi:SagB-type dehydrogenase family enzyme
VKAGRPASRGRALKGFLATLALVCITEQALSMTLIELPQPAEVDGPALSQALHERRSVRDYAKRPLTLTQVAQLMWAAQGINHPSGLRTAPSAGALYPLELILIAGDIDSLESGIYRYRPHQHAIELITTGDRRRQLARAALGQAWIARGAAVLMITAIYERSTGKYGKRGERYAHIEVGHAAQNTLLQAAALGLGAGVVGAFDDAAVAEVCGLSRAEHPVYLLPVGWPAETE